MITKKKFQAYQKVQFSGATNMWNVELVCQLSENILNEDDCLDIMKNYGKYEKQFSK